MARLNLSFLGTYAASLDGIPIADFRSAKTRALLAYLVVEHGRDHPREALIELFWPEQPFKSANANFRQTLSRLQRLLGNKTADPPFLQVTRQTVRWQTTSDYDVDVAHVQQAFGAAASPARLQAALDAYTGDFLAGFFVQDAAGFEDWAAVVRENLHQQINEGYRRFLTHTAAIGDHATTAEYARRLIALSPWDEAACRHLMAALALQGQRSDALAQFERLSATLEDELGVEPEDETLALYEAIAADRLTVPSEAPALPAARTAFVGRVAEQSAVIRTLSDPGCRLLTLVGAGGSGKTRLALEVAGVYERQTGQDVRFVALDEVHDGARALAAMAQALDVPATAVQAEQVAQAVDDVPCLLILDNLEHLRHAAALLDIVAALVDYAPQLKLLATSRAPLRLQREWVYPLGGLALPDAAAVATILDREPFDAPRLLAFDALALFERRATQARLSFALTRSNSADVAALCRAVQGNPLLIELAAAQVARLPVAQIRALLASDPDTFAVDLQDLPPRHRSLRLVLEHSWALLSDDERAVLAQSAVFRDGFSRAAGRAVLADGAALLDGLVAKSLLRRRHTPAGVTRLRYELDAIWRPVLADLQPVTHSTRDRHAGYYLDWAVAHRSRLAEEVANVRAAWAWAQRGERVAAPRRWNPAWLDDLAAQSSQTTAAVPALPPTLPLVGRGAELAVLQQALMPLQAGKNAGLIVVTGAAGIGKSHLVAQLRRAFGAPAWFDAPCAEGDTAVALHPLRHWLRDYFGQATAGVRQVNAETFASRFDDLLQATADPGLRAALQEARPLLALLADVAVDDTAVDDTAVARLRPEQRLVQFEQAIKTLLKAESRLQPLVLHIDDAHWLDGESRALLEKLLLHVETYPFAVLVTARPGQFSPLILLDVPQQTLALEALDAEGVAQLAGHHLGRVPAASVVDLLLERGGGNPFYTAQLLLYLRENGLIRPDGTLASGGDHAQPDTLLPADIHNVLVARLGRLDPAVQAIVAQAAVLGREFAVPVLREVVGDDTAVAEGLAQAQANAIWSAVSPGRYLFSHALLQDAAYALQFDEQRRAAHGKAALAVAAVATAEQPQYAAIARHLDAAEDRPRATRNYLLAGNVARANYFVREAHTHYSRGLELAERDEQRLKLLLGREAVNHWLGNRDEQRQDLAALVALTAGTSDKALLADITLRRATFAMVTGDYQRAVQFAQQTTSQAVGVGDRKLEARAMHQWGRALWQQGKPQAAGPLLERAMRLAERAGDSAVEAQCAYDLSILAYYRHDYDGARATLQRAADQFADLEDKRNVIRCVDMVGVIAEAEGDLEAALEQYRTSVALCQSIDWSYGEATMLAHLGNIHFELGDYGRSREVQTQALQISRMHADLEAQSNSLDTIGLTYLLEGNVPLAIEHFQAAREIAEAISNADLKAFAATHLGLALTAVEEIEEAGILLYEALVARSDLHSEPVAMDTQAALAWLDLARGDGDLAAERARDIVAFLNEHGRAGVELPFQVYWQCIVILQQTGAQAEADAALETAYSQLQEQAARIQDAELRLNYLRNVPFHRQIGAAYHARFG